MTINYTDRKVNFTKLLQCRNLYSFDFERAELPRILRHGTDFEVWNVASRGRKVDWTLQVGQ